MKIKMRKIIALSLSILGFSCFCVAQQDVLFSQYMFNRLSYNPAYAGSSGSICATVMYRNQWLGLKLDPPAEGYTAGSTPTDYLFSFDLPVKFLHGGLGLVAASDKLGYNSSFFGGLDYAFRIFWGPGNMSAGVEATVMSVSRDYTQLIGSSSMTGTIYNPIGDTEDPLLSGGKDANDMMIDVATGIYYQVPGLYYFGISVKNLLAAHSDILHFQNARTVYLMGGYDYVIPANPSFRLKPSALVKMADFNLRSLQLEGTCLLEYQNAFWGGVSYRFQDAIVFLAGINWNKIRIGAAYDLTTSRLGTPGKSGRSAGTLEVYLRYCFKVIIPPKPPSVYRNTRYLF